jgi:hypothetical protein
MHRTVHSREMMSTMKVLQRVWSTLLGQKEDMPEKDGGSNDLYSVVPSSIDQQTH